MAMEILTTVRGIIIAAGWESNGEISAVDIAGYDEKTYRVVNDEIGKRLRSFIKMRVAADGIVTTQMDMLTIQLHRFQIDTSDPKTPAA
jgi:hypothetical protein